MGYLLKEALKTLCGVNQWSYAIFWKIGCQNPKLLIWEECYYENSGTSVSRSDFEAWSSAEMNNGQLGMQAENRVHFLITKMMMDNHVNVVGEGLVGRAAFTGTHQWILSHNYNQAAYPPEVLKEVFQQFSAGMQTIAVIPVLPHGVVQLASDMPVMENTAFVDDVKNLVLQLGCVPGILLSENYTSNETAPKIGIPVGKSIPGTIKPLVNESCNYKGDLADKTAYVGLSNVRPAMFPPSSSLPMPHATQYEAEMIHSANARHTYMTQLANSVAKAEVIPANPEMWLNQPTFGCFPRSTFDMQPSVGSSSLGGGLSMIEQQILAGRAVQEHSSTKLNVSGGLLTSSLETNSGLVPTSSQGFGDCRPAAEGELYGVAMGSLSSFSNFGSLSNANLPSRTNESGPRQGVSRVKIANSPKPIISSSGVSGNPALNKVLTSSFASGYSSIDNNVQKDVADVIDDLDYDFYKALSVPHSAHVWSKTSSESMSGPVRKEEMEEYGAHGVSTGDITYGVTNTELYSGDDLFDVLGVDFKNKLLNGSWNNSQDSGSESSITNLNKKNPAAVKGSLAAAELLALSRGQTNNSMPQMRGKDHLLDAMISSIQSSAKQTLDDNTSCKTTITITSSSSVPDVSASGGEVGVSGQMQAELFGFTKSAGKPAMFGSSLFKPEPCKDSVRSYSQGSSLYGSQISSWTDQDLDHKPSSSVSTGYSKKTDDTGKSNRKRLKPGENPRPRPKDRQMIQDRVKELREIVPNGAKCSIDALLERTIKHMLFLQSVTKHADKLKQSGESKIFSKESGLVTKANCDGGATWAYEVGSQSTVCPIIVEDLNQPRQMLVEMLCEGRGLFLEIADIIRGLGLTILKGVMEAQKDKIWARFAVEANRDVTRMEIFISLVRLLEQNIKNGVPAASGIDNDAMMAQQFPLPGTSIPATVRTCGL